MVARMTLSPRRALTRGSVALLAFVDPRFYVHGLKMVRLCYDGHVRQLRLMTFGGEVHISPTASFAHGERITIGRGTHVGERCSLWAGKSTGRITIGDNVLIAPDVFVTAANYATALGAPLMDQPMVERDVVIGNDVWLATKVVVLPGVHIGDGCVVGAGAVVTRDLPAGSIAVGVPARVVGSRL
jgi:acetyltransferase-like isoleucine patch superfamily enzyme